MLLDRMIPCSWGEDGAKGCGNTGRSCAEICPGDLPWKPLYRQSAAAEVCCYAFAIGARGLSFHGQHHAHCHLPQLSEQLWAASGRLSMMHLSLFLSLSYSLCACACAAHSLPVCSLSLANTKRWQSRASAGPTRQRRGGRTRLDTRDPSPSPSPEACETSSRCAKQTNMRQKEAERAGNNQD